ncbi:ammonium transporter, partial [bacterium]|nr:ammonium transporter [bacterium]
MPHGSCKVNAANTVFMVLSSILVFLMTPGLAFFYGGLSDKKNVLGIKIQSFVSLGVTAVLWFLVGYSLCFSGDVYGVIGNLDMMCLRGVTPETLFPSTGIPLLVFISYQMMFAIITPALITGAFINRITFKAYLLFLVLWQLVVYYPFAHMVWGGGVLSKLGALDFAGGLVVHILAGMAALAAVFFVGKRKNSDTQSHNIPFIALGTGLLWFGWFGFNAGSALAVNSTMAVAFFNTHLSAATAAITWLLIDWKWYGKPKLVGFLTGGVAGLVAITPGAGFVAPGSAAVIGVAASIICFYAVVVKNNFGWDDALDVWGVHGVGGI